MKTVLVFIGMLLLMGCLFIVFDKFDMSWLRYVLLVVMAGWLIFCLWSLAKIFTGKDL